MAGITLGPNIPSLAALRGLDDATSEVTKAYERLSSGMRINRASDDAAGLSISASLNASAKIFTQAIRNINDAISATSISEAALGSLSGIAQRQMELAAQAANGSYSFTQRKAMNREADALTDEFNRIVQSTSFNGIQLLSTFGTTLAIQAGTGSSGIISSSLNTALARGTGDGTFQAPISVAGLAGFQGIATGDFNGDGRLDIAESGSGRVAVRLGNGDGTFSTGVSVVIAGGGYSVLVGDLNGDGKLDLAAPNSTGSGVYSILGNGDGTFSAAVSYTTAGGLYRAAIGDMNGDGKLDIVSVSGSGTTVSVSIGNGDGSFRAGISGSSGVANTDTLAIGDFNGDSILDVALGDFSSGNVSIRLGYGDGTFRSGGVLSSGTASAGRITSGDLNHDGISDIITTDTSTAKVHVFLSNGSGTFQAATSYSTGVPLIAAIGDFDGDGYNDIFAPDGSAAFGTVFLNRGNGTFNAGVSYSLGTGTGTISTTGDFNGDGATDVATATGGNYAAVLLGTPTKRTTIAYLDLFTQGAARSSLDIATATSTRISQELGQLGAFTSRFDTAIRNLEAARENYLAAESRIKDADIAGESATLVRQRILQQAASSVLAQANQAPQLALKLLGG